MSINVDFYTFSKKENSTEQPNPLYKTTYACVLKDACGILNPSITLNLGTSGNPASFNYAYINDFSRYYFIDEWTYEQGLWTASMHVDVLATYKAGIGLSTQYVLRAATSAAWDDKIVDNYYPAKGFYTTSVETKDNFWSMTNATLILGVVAPDSGTSITRAAVRYYALTSAQATALFDWMFNINNYNITDITSDLAKTLFNPFQYISSAFWVPFSVTGGVSSTIKYGYWNTGLTATEIAGDSYKWLTGSFTIPQHPQAATRGDYLNMSPYSKYILDFPPFGRFELDSLIVGDAPTLYFGVAVDLQNGTGKLSVSTKRIAGGTTIDIDNINVGQFDGDVGVPIILAQMLPNNPAGLLGSVASSAISIATGNIAGAISSIGNALSSSIPELQMSGSQGSVTNYYIGKPKLITRTVNIVDANDDHSGRPVCKELVLNTLAASATSSGYILCADGDLPFSATSTELVQIRNYLTGGFFYE